MALVKCRHCGKEASAEVLHCPSCGKQLKAQDKKFLSLPCQLPEFIVYVSGVIGMVVALIIIYFTVYKPGDWGTLVVSIVICGGVLIAILVYIAILIRIVKARRARRK